MVRLFLSLLLTVPLVFTGCASMEMGSAHESDPNGSYSGSTLNSSVTDQNPSVGGNNSYPAEADTGKPLATPDKLDGR